MFFIKSSVSSGENSTAFYSIPSSIFRFTLKTWIRNINYTTLTTTACIGNKWKKIGTKNINNFNIIHVGVSRSWGKITRFLNKHKRATGILILESVTSESLSIFERNMQVLVVVTRIHSWTRWSRKQKSHCCVFIVHLGNKISCNEKRHHFIDYKIMTLKNGQI